MANAECKPYSFEPMGNNSSLEDEASEGEEPRRGNTTCAVVTFVQTGKGNKKENVYVQARRSIKLWTEFQVNIF